MALTILIKCCEFIEHSKPNNLTLSGFIEKFPEGKKIRCIHYFYHSKLMTLCTIQTKKLLFLNDQISSMHKIGTKLIMKQNHEAST